LLLKKYLQDLEKLVSACPVSVSHSVNLEIRATNIGFIQGMIIFIDASTLFFSEYIVYDKNLIRQKYRYHFQNENKKIIFRYDNVGKYKKLPNFPHHKHIQGTRGEYLVQPSNEESLEDILKLIISIVLGK
jgi:hypothetical protein